MKCKIIKLEQLSGNGSSIYSIYVDDSKKTLFEIFIEENIISFKSELKDIIDRLNIMGKKTGAREQFFKLNEGNMGDGLCALMEY